MSDDPEIRKDLLDDGFSDKEIEELQKAIKSSEKLSNTLRAYNRAVEKADQQEKFYQRKISKLKQNIDNKVSAGRKNGFMKKAVSPSKSRSASSSNKTPVMRGVVTKEYDGDRIWVEPKSAPRGEYGVDVPSGFDAEDLNAGTEVALDPQNFTILDVVKESKDPDFKPVESDKTFSDVGGLDEVIDTLRRNVGVQLNDERRAKVDEWGLDLDKSLMLVGPPGTGKTLLVKALANEYDIDMYMVNGPQLVEKFIGEGAKKIRRLYSQARSGERPSIVFIDEIDSIAKKRQEDRRHGGEEVERTMSQLLSEIDGLDKEDGNQNVISVFATNNPSILDPAIINRCSAVEVGVPGGKAKKEILQVHTRDFPLDEGLDFGKVVEEVPEDYTGRDIAQICKQAAINALYSEDGFEDIEVEISDFMAAIKDLKEGNIGMGKEFIGQDNEFHEEIFA
ncbi:MAG: AAA family ATPase [Candidatus Nanohaloarchaeota archaeon QJJ-9]|nr:AAA family ATPase [Candidatus Nanohaloarchaeota archaeon QJJ-9]